MVLLFFSFGFVAVVPNSKLAKRSRYLSETLFTTYHTRIILLPCVTTLFILPSQKKEVNSR